MDGTGPTGVPAAAEAAAEARDAVTTFKGKAVKSFLNVLSQGTAPAKGAGGAHRSVYSILVLGSEHRDSTGSAFAFESGLREGINVAAGPWSSRFRIFPSSASGSDTEVTVRSRREIDEFNHGVVVVAGGRQAAWTVAFTLGMAEGFVVADGRPEGDVEVDAEVFARTYGTAEADVRNQRVFYFGSGLTYRKAEAPGAPHEEEFRPFQLRPSSAERARRLGEWIGTQPEIKQVAIAIPEQGGDLVLAAAFLNAAESLGRKVEILAYEPGRRNYAPEAERFLATRAQAILLAGPGEESGEWLTALAAKKAKPIVLGTRELDPAGFHERIRPLLEGAVFTGVDWEDRNADLVARMRSTNAEAGPDFRRGFRFGWVVARAVIEGAYTPTSLRLALEERSHPRPLGQFSRHVIGITRTGESRPTEVILPLYMVRNRVPVRLDLSP
jgi:hypothetical protein